MRTPQLALFVSNRTFDDFMGKAAQPLSHSLSFHEDTKQKLLQRLRQEVSGSLGAQGRSADAGELDRAGRWTKVLFWFEDNLKKMLRSYSKGFSLEGHWLKSGRV